MAAVFNSGAQKRVMQVMHYHANDFLLTYSSKSQFKVDVEKKEVLSFPFQFNVRVLTHTNPFCIYGIEHSMV